MQEKSVDAPYAVFIYRRFGGIWKCVSDWWEMISMICCADASADWLNYKKYIEKVGDYIFRKYQLNSKFVSSKHFSFAVDFP